MEPHTAFQTGEEWTENRARIMEQLPQHFSKTRARAASEAVRQQLTHAHRAEVKRGDPQRANQNSRYTRLQKMMSICLVLKTPRSREDHSSFTDEEAGAPAKTKLIPDRTGMGTQVESGPFTAA